MYYYLSVLVGFVLGILLMCLLKISVRPMRETVGGVLAQRIDRILDGWLPYNPQTHHLRELPSVKAAREKNEAAREAERAAVWKAVGRI